MRLFALLLAIGVALGSSGAGAQQPRPSNSIEGPLPVIIKGDNPGSTPMRVTPSGTWARGDAARVWVDGVSAREWTYDHVCLAPSASPWAELDAKGHDGWELVGTSGIPCAKDGGSGSWFLLKRPAASK